MRRRTSDGPAELMPEHLVEFRAPEWGWDGPQYQDGHLVTGWHEAEARWYASQRLWTAEHPGFDWLADIVRRFPDAPWTAA